MKNLYDVLCNCVIVISVLGNALCTDPATDSSFAKVDEDEQSMILSSVLEVSLRIHPEEFC